MAVKNFKDLRAYQKAFSAALEVHKISLTFPEIERYSLADQMRRASKSICANIAEGFGKQTQSRNEFNRYLNIAIGSANEMCVWIDFCKEFKYIDHNEAEKMLDDFDHIAKMLNKLRNV